MKKEVFMKKSTKHFLIYSLLVSFFSFVFLSILDFAGIFTSLENKLYDWRMKSSSKKFAVSDDFCYIGIDQDSINSANREKKWGWPWPRSSYAEIVDFLKEGGAKAVIFDVFFTEHSVYGKEDDRIFAESCKNAGNVIQVFHEVRNENQNEKSEVLFPIEEIKNSASLLGNITSSMDEDGVIRRSRISYNFNGNEYVTLGLAGEILESENISDSISEIKSKVPLLKDETVLLRYKDFSKYAGYKAWDILKSAENYKKGLPSDFVPSDFENCTVFFMFYAPGLYDICSTPMSKNYPGSGVHITLLDNYLTDDFVKKVPVAFDLIYSLIFAFLGGILVFLVENRLKHFKILYFVLIVVFGQFINLLITRLFFDSNYYINSILPVFCFALSYLAEIFLSYRLEGKQKHFIKTAFAQYLSPSVIDKILSNPESLKLGGERRHISIFFSDIESFTSLSEKLSPEKLTETLNEYLSEMTKIIIRSGGTIDKYEGDSIVAFWNAPVQIENHAKSALDAAVECQCRLKNLENSFVKKVGSSLPTRIGINSGEAIVGNMGSDLRFDYTMIGDSVNIASRLEGLNKSFGTYLMCSKNTKDEAQKSGSSLYFRELARVKVVGKNNAITVFEPVVREEYEAQKEKYSTFEKALNCFYKADFDEAQKLFESIKKTDRVSEKYIQKCEEMKNLGEEELKNFDGVWVSKNK